jgi:hypothetical protein
MRATGLSGAVLGAYFAGQCVPRSAETEEELSNERSVLAKLRQLEANCDEGPFGAQWTQSELDEAIALLPTGKAAGPDDVPSELIAQCPDSARDVIRAVLNFSLQRGVLPQQWRDANAVPLYKQSRPHAKPPSYRPISLTVILCKLAEMMLLKRFSPLKKYLYSHQFA